MQNYTVPAFTLSGTVMLLTDLTSAPDDKSIGIKYCQKIREEVYCIDTHIDTAYEKYRRYLCQYSKSVADTIGTNSNTAILTTLAVVCSYKHIHVNSCYNWIRTRWFTFTVYDFVVFFCDWTVWTSVLLN